VGEKRLLEAKETAGEIGNHLLKFSPVASFEASSPKQVRTVVRQFDGPKIPRLD